MPWNGIVGHDRLRDLFQRAISQHRLGHAYLFVGPEGVGKKAFALNLAKVLCCLHVTNNFESCGTCNRCVQIAADTYPDLHQVGLPEDKHEFPVEVMQELISRLTIKPMYDDGKRIAIIDDADVLNEESSNCLLKTLEEPPPQSLLILIGTASTRQLPTIRSRCQVIQFQPLSESDLATVCLSTGLVEDAKAAGELAKRASGSLTSAKLWQDEDVARWCQLAQEHLSLTKFNAFDFAKKTNEFIDAAGKESAAKRQRAAFAIDFLTGLIQRSLHGKATKVDIAQRLGEEGTIKLLERCLAAEHHIDRKFQVSLVIEALADAMGQQLMTASKV